MKSVSAIGRSDHRLAQVRAGFVGRGTSFHAWCKNNGVDTANARKALAGRWIGPKATELVEKLQHAAGVTE
ncbi:hypothetical protein [Pararhodobacter marinus]|uniref:hypothetical protein n=1 Tax=Pararhodobacter marinus TaxID=2184063 RepID=UPI00355A2C57